MRKKTLVRFIVPPLRSSCVARSTPESMAQNQSLCEHVAPNTLGGLFFNPPNVQEVLQKRLRQLDADDLSQSRRGGTEVGKVKGTVGSSR